MSGDDKGRALGIAFPAMLLAFALSGCIPLPVATPEENPFKEVAEGFFTPGSSTSDSVQEKLGEPALQGSDWWLYRDTREGWQWAFCAGGGYSAGCGALPRAKVHDYYAVDFDSLGVVTQTELLSENELCDTRRICYEGDILMRSATQSEDTAAKRFRVPPVGCSVFTYSTTDSDSAAGELIIDGEIVGALVGTSGYHLHTVAPGRHAWVVVPSRDKQLPLMAARTAFDCEGRQVAYLRYRNGLWGVKIEPVDPERGERDIRDRWLAISIPEYGEMMQSNWLRDGQIFVTRQGETVTVFQLVESDKIPRWGAGESGEPCGMRAALEDYGLSPVGAHTGLQFAESLTSLVQLRAVCANESNCTFESVIEGEFCDALPGTEIEFETYSKLLVLEPDGGSYAELFYGEAKSLKRHAICEDQMCRIDIEELRRINRGTGDSGESG
jgi:hypothetical protein